MLESSRVRPRVPLLGPAPSDAVLAFCAVEDDGEWRTRACVETTRLLFAVVLAVSSAPVDVVTYVKYADDGEGLAMLDMLQSTMTDTSNADGLARQIKDARRAADAAGAKAHAFKQRRFKLERDAAHGCAKAASSQLAQRIASVVADGESARCQALLAQRRAQLTALERRVDQTWAQLTTADDGPSKSKSTRKINPLPRGTKHETRLAAARAAAPPGSLSHTALSEYQSLTREFFFFKKRSFFFLEKSKYFLPKSS